MESTRKAHAKINWTLEVLGAFSEDHPHAGYHEIRSIMSLLELHDVVTIRCKADPAGDINIYADHPKVPQTSLGNSKGNSCHKALVVLRQQFPQLSQYSFEVHIQKRIPLAGGLGGSSTDGAAVLLMVIEMFALSITRQDLLVLASLFGSDTPFFAAGENLALVEGRGEKITSLPQLSDSAHLVLLNPRREILVSEVFKSLPKNLPRARSSAGVNLHQNSSSISLDLLLPLCHNDLEIAPYIQSEFPELPAIKEAMLKSGCRFAQMSGSGGTVFGVFDSARKAKEAATILQNSYPQFEVFTSAIMR